MKTILSGAFLILFLGLGCGFSLKMPKGKNIQIRIELDSSISNYEQWVYLHHYNYNDHIIDDSVFIERGQKEILLYAYTQEEHAFSILFSERGPIDWYLNLMPNSYVETSVSVSDGFSPSKQVKGSYSTNERVQKVQSSFILNQKKRELYAKLSMPRLSDEESEIVTTQISRIDMQLDSIQMAIVLNSASAYNTELALKYYFKNRVSKDSLITLCNIALKRFPDSKKIERVIRPIKIKTPPESEESKRIDRHLKSIIEKRMMENVRIERKKKQSGVSSEDISAISLLSDRGEEISISQLNSEFILLDFWASWCIPCREGMPYIRQAKELCGDKLTVCLISMDKKPENWKKAIGVEKIGKFINLTAIDDKGNIDDKVEALNINAIPYNILLDKNYKIIARNIHQKELLNKLYALIHH